MGEVEKVEAKKILESLVHGERLRSNKKNDHFYRKYGPITGEELYKVDFLDASQLTDVLDSSEKSFYVWRNITPKNRGQILRKAASILREKTEMLAQLEVSDTGRPIREIRSYDIPSAADCLEYFASLAEDISGEQRSYANALGLVLREPLGVCLSIGAWNFPLQIACWKVAPALSMGNSVIFKPSELTSSTALALGEIFIEAGMPPGVFNVVLGDGELCSKLVKEKRIAKVSLTGSVATGQKVAYGACENLTPVSLELGGKSPLIVFQDADLDLAVEQALVANFGSCGEVCSNATRVFVHAEIHREFIAALAKKTALLKIGDPFLEETEVGPLISKGHLQKVLSYVDQGMKEGAHKVCGGEHPFQTLTHDMRKGNFIAPVIFDRCQDDMQICREEIFGPVMSLMTFRSEAEVLARANASSFGLAAGVFTKDLVVGYRMARSLDVGVCWINSYNETPVDMPFGGYKMSGYGRENGRAALDSYTQWKSIYIRMD